MRADAWLAWAIVMPVPDVMSSMVQPPLVCGVREGAISNSF